MNTRTERQRHAWKGLFAGVLGGLAGSFAMSQFHSLVFRNAQTSFEPGQEDSTVLAASAISRTVFCHELTDKQKKLAAPAVHYGFGAGMGAVYAMLVEIANMPRAGWGMAFGAAVWLGAHVIAVPALDLSKPVTQSSAKAEAAEFGAHLLYGVATESVRRLLRSC